ncbi:putative transferase [Helianthus annuus]|nr:putative transferase [Helianthus annuus]
MLPRVRTRQGELTAELAWSGSGSRSGITPAVGRTVHYSPPPPTSALCCCRHSLFKSGNSAVQAIKLLIKKGVPEGNIIFLNLISAPQGVHVVCKEFPRIKIVTSEIETGLNEEFRVVPGMGEFGDRYFGTDDE